MEFRTLSKNHVTIGPDGCIEIRDRSKDMIKSGGEWISSVALENSLMNHRAILEAAVIGIPDHKWMERSFAYVVPREGTDVSEAALREFLASSFAKFWIPDDFAFVASITKTSVGKFRKSPLRELHSRSLE
jgi:fatty-acyl-CoA synthase